MGTDNEKIRKKLDVEVIASDDTITINYLKMVAEGTDNNEALAEEVRRVLGVPKSRKPRLEINTEYLPCNKKL